MCHSHIPIELLEDHAEAIEELTDELEPDELEEEPPKIEVTP